LQCTINGVVGITDGTKVNANSISTPCNVSGATGGPISYTCLGGIFTKTAGSCAINNHTNSSCFNTWENGTLTMTAPAGKTWAGVTFASYGTPNSCVVGSCNATNSVSIISAACVNRTTCTISANNDIFSDPCYGTGKRLHVILYYY
jgi:hypothetical protein